MGTSVIAKSQETMVCTETATGTIIWTDEFDHKRDDAFLILDQLGNRIATADTHIDAMPVTRGTPVTLCIGAANRDPEQFEAADCFDIARQPNRHLAFGFGIHQCAGLSLARLEARIAIGRFIARFPDYRLVGAPLRAPRARFRGFVKAPVVVG